MSLQDEPLSIADAEKRRAALSSIFWALLLTSAKLGAGIYTNSLGILSEALHSGLDLVAAGITYMAVRVASRPADKGHPYGYGKIENLSALAETALLLVTCGWIVREAVERLFFDAPQITPSWWGVGIILFSLVVDINRAAMLRRVAKKHKSQALEADALHFTTDIWSSGVVLVGLLCVQASAMLPAGHPLAGPLHMADAAAALVVSGIVVLVSVRLSRRAVSALLDGGGREHSEALEKALARDLPLYTVRRLRVRESGADVFMDITVEAPPNLRLDAAHDVTRLVEDIARDVVPGADVTVHVEPRAEEDASPLQLARSIAAAHQLSIHNLVLSMQTMGQPMGQTTGQTDGQNHERNEGLLVYLHVEAPPDLSLTEAHNRVTAFEEALGKRLNAARIVSHIEPDDACAAPDGALPAHKTAERMDPETLRAIVDKALPAFPAISAVHDLEITRLGGGPLFSFHCCLPGDVSVAEAHAAASALEREIRKSIPGLERVLIHTDPARNAAAQRPSREPDAGL